MKKNIYTIKAFFCLIAITMVSTACTKDFLDLKRNKSQVIPVSLEDYRSLFERDVMNYFSSHLLGEIGSDDYFISSQQWQGLSDPIQQNGYIWADEIYQGQPSSDWNRGYERILYSNFVLEGLSEINETSSNKLFRDEVIGAAHFFRGTNFFHLTQLFCRQYDGQTANSDLGLPLRLTSNINQTYQRATLGETYNQIIDDLKMAAFLLPDEMSLNTRPYRASALGMLANVYLQMGDYESSFRHADTALSLATEILDYNLVDTSSNVPFPLYGQGNKEIVFNSLMEYSAILFNSILTVDTALYDSYNEHDIRKWAFFFLNNGRRTFKGHYTGVSAFMFSGLTTAEILLVRAECNVQLNKIESAVTDLNLLLSNRIESEYFQPISSDISQSELLKVVLEERRKELIFRGRRWYDLKRFQKDPSLAKPLIRILDGVEYTLPLSSPKWVWPIPPDVISRGGYAQNER